MGGDHDVDELEVVVSQDPDQQNGQYRGSTVDFENSKSLQQAFVLRDDGPLCPYYITHV